MARGTKDVRVSGGLEIVALVPGGAHVCRLKLCIPSRTAYIDSCGCTLEVQIMFRESCACGMILSHRSDGNAASHVEMTDIR